MTSPVTQPDDVSGKTIKCVFTHADFTFNEPAVGMNYPEVISKYITKEGRLTRKFSSDIKPTF